MRKAFLEVATYAEAEALAPWASEIISAEGGFWVFESVADAGIWINQL